MIKIIKKYFFNYKNINMCLLLYIENLNAKLVIVKGTSTYIDLSTIFHDDVIDDNGGLLKFYSLKKIVDSLKDYTDSSYDNVYETFYKNIIRFNILYEIYNITQETNCYEEIEKTFITIERTKNMLSSPNKELIKTYNIYNKFNAIVKGKEYFNTNHIMRKITNQYMNIKSISLHSCNEMLKPNYLLINDIDISMYKNKLIDNEDILNKKNINKDILFDSIILKSLYPIYYNSQTKTARIYIDYQKTFPKNVKKIKYLGIELENIIKEKNLILSNLKTYTFEYPQIESTNHFFKTISIKYLNNYIIDYSFLKEEMKLVYLEEIIVRLIKLKEIDKLCNGVIINKNYKVILDLINNMNNLLSKITLKEEEHYIEECIKETGKILNKMCLISQNIYENSITKEEKATYLHTNIQQEQNIIQFLEDIKFINNIYDEQLDEELK